MYCTLGYLKKEVVLGEEGYFSLHANLVNMRMYM